MKTIFLPIICALFFMPNLSLNAASTDKVYVVEKNQAEFNIGPSEDLGKTKEKRRPADLWNVTVSRSSLNYQLPSLLGGATKFSPDLVGVSVGKKMQNQFFLYQGYWEVSGEWQRFNRQSHSANGIVYSQHLDLYQMNLFQNFKLASAFKHQLYFTVGLGVAPLFLTAEQSVIGNSQSEPGYLGMVKMNVIYPLKKSLELDLVLKSGWGNAGDHDLFLASIGLGVNFE